MNEEQEQNGTNDETKSPNLNNPVVKRKPFLARGSGLAGGGKGLAASNQKTPARSKD
jgi:hypothetical protein